MISGGWWEPMQVLPGRELSKATTYLLILYQIYQMEALMLAVSHSLCLINCCYVEIKGIQCLKIYSQILSVSDQGSLDPNTTAFVIIDMQVTTAHV